MWRLTLFLIGGCLAMPARAETLEDSARNLGRRVLSRLAAPERLAVQVRVLSPVAAGERERVDRSLRETLARHVAPSESSGTAQLRVTVSAALARRVLVAEFSRAGEEPAVMLAEYDTSDVVARPVRARPLLERALLWEQDDRILDVASGDGGGFWVLDTERMTQRDRSGEVRRQVGVRRADVAWPRDVRGRVTVSSGEPHAWMPGSNAWPLAPGLDASPAGENEFSIAGAKDRFFTAARVAPAAFVLAGVDGRMRWSEGGAQRELDGQWGSEVVALADPCRAGGGTIVVTSHRDGQSLGVFEAVARALRPAGDGMTLPGTLSALWPAEGDASATAVVRTPAGRYAAYRVFANCSR